MSTDNTESFYFSSPKKDDPEFEREWSEYSKVVLSAYMVDPWFSMAIPNALERRQYLENTFDQFYENCLLKERGRFATLKLKGSKRDIIGGVAINLQMNEVQIKNPQNMDEIRLNFSNEQVVGPLKKITDKYNTGLWYATMWAIEPALIGTRIGQAFSAKIYKHLMGVVVEWLKEMGKVLSYPPLVYGLTKHKSIKDSATKQSTGLCELGKVTYKHEAFKEVTDYFFGLKLPGNEAMFEETIQTFKDCV